MEKGIFFAIICLQETWIKAGADTSSFQLNGCNMINKFCCCSDHGGLLIYVLSDFKIEILKQITQSNTWEGLFVEVKKANIDKTFIIGNIYKPPRDNNSRQNTKTFINGLEPILYELNNIHKEVILAGDYNLNLLKTSDIPHYSEFFDSMLNNSFFPKISFPTRLGRHSCSLIDNSMVKYRLTCYKQKQASCSPEFRTICLTLWDWSVNIRENQITLGKWKQG